MNCRHCGSPLTLPFLDLGTAPPSNAYLRRDDLDRPERWFPLRVLACTTCWLVQTEDYAHHADLFSADYAYFSSYSTSWQAHAARFVALATERFGLGPRSQVVEVASNDGYLLQYVRDRGISCLGVEPTADTARAARAKGIDTVEAFFGVELAGRLVAEGRSADLAIANNVLAHVPDINDFVAGFAKLLKPGGVATFEFPHLLQLVDECQFDTVYHEHFSYLSLTAVARIFEGGGLAIFDVEELPTHGGSLRVYAQPRDGRRFDVSGRVGALLAREAEGGMTSADYYVGFQERADRVKDALLGFLLESKAAGRRVAAYGAAAKGNTILNYAGVRADLLPWVVDRNGAKQGKFMPGSRIPIVDEGRLHAEKPELIVILPWNLRAEVVEQLTYARRWGARFVTAVPSLRVE